MFFDLAYSKLSGDTVSLSSLSRVTCNCDCYAYEYAQKTVSDLPSNGDFANISLFTSIPDSVKDAVGESYRDDNEAYAIVIDEEVKLYGANERALIYAVSTFRQLIEENELKHGLIFDYPDKSVRGYRVFIPARESFDAFKNMVDDLVYYKYNLIIIEVGGAMEYKRHPEINEKWIEFCEEVHQSPYEARRIQNQTHPQWAKNSIHADNGGGKFITQEEMRALIDYCRNRGLEVVPEVPTLSHSDYIVMAHPELNERADDTYPDTYCPSNPKTYEIVFDILDEVIEVFTPRAVHIGHDEVYTLAKCELCRGKKPVDLYVGDIVKINDYLKSRGIRTMMWCEKMFKTHYSDGWPIGGSANPGLDIPALYECAGRIPKDVILINWYWSLIDGKSEERILDMEYEMLYGNFSALNLDNYRQRSSRICGGFESNWGAFEYPYMQRNHQNFSLVANAYVFWSSKYDSADKDEIFNKVSNKLCEDYIKKFCAEDSLIEVEHTVDTYIKHEMFYDGYFITDDEWLIGNYKVSFDDGTVALLPVRYGYNICYSERGNGKTVLTSDIVLETIGASIPFDHNGKIYYRTFFVNPYPHKSVSKIEYVKIKDINVEVLNIKY